jgi:predicted nucleic acid-binding protein
MKQLVCDTGPLNYLIQIEAVEFLPALFPRILIPHSVYHELIAPAAPPQVRAWSGDLPSWCLTLSTNTRLEGTFHGLSEADLEVLSIARETKAAILIDDLAARKAARRLGLPLLGTLGFLELAATRKRLSLPEAVSRLQQTNIRISEDLYHEVLLRNGLGK